MSLLEVAHMRALAWVGVILGSMLCAQFAYSTEDPDPPSNAEAKNWIAINDRLGFVVVESVERMPGTGSRQILVAPPERISPELMPPIKGYFMAKTVNGWRRLVIAEPAELSSAAD
jgi:hypothetical protein